MLNSSRLYLDYEIAVQGIHRWLTKHMKEAVDKRWHIRYQVFIKLARRSLFL